MANLYRGFSTIGRNRKFRLTDFELIKQDLINHFSIRKGEKLMQPEFGTIIWNVIHEPFTEELKSIIAADVKSVVTYDPRIAIDQIIVREYEQGIQIEIDVRNLQTDQTQLMNLKFDNKYQTLSAG